MTKRISAIEIDTVADQPRQSEAVRWCRVASEVRRRWQDVRSSLMRRLDVHQFLADRRDLLSPDDIEGWPAPGEEMLGFRLVEELGRGALGRVFLATEASVGNRQVVVKLSPYGGEEAEILGKLDHPNIVPVHSVQHDPTSGLSAICMRYVGRTTLADVIEELRRPSARARDAQVMLDAVGRRSTDKNIASPSRWPWRRRSYVDQVLILTAQVADALSYTHRQGILHRDLKPSNVLLTPEGQAMLLDFNLSAELDAVVARVGGTLPYMSPEQLRATFVDGPEAVRLDRRSDIFSLGVLLFEALSGQLPFGPKQGSATDLGTVAAICEQHGRGAPDVRTHNRFVDSRLAGLLQRCLAVDPAGRPSSAELLAKELRACLRPHRRLTRLARRRPLATGVATLFAMVMASLVAIALATRPPYVQRQFRDGVKAYREQAWSTAMGHFTQAAEADPRLTDALVGQARVLQAQGHLGAAVATFLQANEIRPEPRIPAAVGYCHSLMGEHEYAIHWYDRAIKEGFATAAVYNNRGFSHRRRAHFAEAQQDLDRAIRAAPDLAAALHNRAALAIHRGKPADPAVISRGLEDIHAALKAGADSPHAWQMAAYLTLFDGTTSAHIDRALDYLTHAVDRGASPSAFGADIFFEPLVNDERFRQLCSRPEPPSPPGDAPYAVDPWDGWPDLAPNE